MQDTGPDLADTRVPGLLPQAGVAGARQPLGDDGDATGRGQRPAGVGGGRCTGGDPVQQGRLAAPVEAGDEQMLPGAQVDGDRGEASRDGRITSRDRQAIAGDDLRQVEVQAIGAGPADLDGIERGQPPVVIPTAPRRGRRSAIRVELLGHSDFRADTVVVRGAVVPDGFGLAAVPDEGALGLLLGGVGALVGSASAGLVLQVVGVGAGAAVDAGHPSTTGDGQKRLPGGGVEVEDADGGVIDEGAVMTGQQDVPLPPAESLGEESDCPVVEVVGRLVQKERGGADDQSSGQRGGRAGRATGTPVRASAPRSRQGRRARDQRAPR